MIPFCSNLCVDNLKIEIVKERKIARREYREILKRNYRQSIPQLCHAHNTNRTVNRLWWTRLHSYTKWHDLMDHVRYSIYETEEQIRPSINKKDSHIFHSFLLYKFPSTFVSKNRSLQKSFHEYIWQPLQDSNNCIKELDERWNSCFQYTWIWK